MLKVHQSASFCIYQQNNDYYYSLRASKTEQLITLETLNKYPKINEFIKQNYWRFYESVMGVVLLPLRKVSLSKFKDWYFYKSKNLVPEKQIFLHKDHSDVPEGYVQVLCLKNNIYFYYNIKEEEYNSFKTENPDLPFMCGKPNHELIDQEVATK